MNTRNYIMAIGIVCFITGAYFDIKIGNFKSGILALMYGLCNAIVFFI